MDYEKKKRLAELRDSMKSYGYVDGVEELEDIFPEIKESEDEKIRKMLIEQMERWKKMAEENGVEQDVNDATSAIAYLERQKEQKSLNVSAASEWLREHVCRYINSEYNEFHKCVEYDGSIDKERLINDFEEAMQKEQKPVEQEWPNLSNCIRNCKKCRGKCFYRKEPYEEQKPAEWSEEEKERIRQNGRLDVCYNPEKYGLCHKTEWGEGEMEMLDSIIDDYENAAKSFGGYDGKIMFLKAIRDGEYGLSKQELSEEDIKKIRSEEYTKGFNDAAFGGKLKEWSEEDEKFIRDLCNLLASIAKNNYVGGYYAPDLVSKLQSLRPHPHTVSIKDATKFGNLEYERGVKDGIQSEKNRQWKPSEEQVKAIDLAIRFVTDDFSEHPTLSETLRGLYNELKKL